MNGVHAHGLRKAFELALSDEIEDQAGEKAAIEVAGIDLETGITVGHGAFEPGGNGISRQLFLYTGG